MPQVIGNASQTDVRNPHDSIEKQPIANTEIIDRPVPGGINTATGSVLAVQEKQSAFLYLTGATLTSVLGILLFITIASYLGPSDYGRFSVFNSFLLLLSICSLPGFTSAIRNSSAIGAMDLVKKLSVFRFGGCFLITLVLILVWFCGLFPVKIPEMAFILVAFLSIFHFGLDWTVSFFLGNREVGRALIILNSIAIMKLLAMAAAIHLFHSTRLLVVILISYGISAIIFIIAFAFGVYTRLSIGAQESPTSPETRRSMFRFGQYQTLTCSLSLVRRYLDNLVLLVLLPLEQISFYAISKTLIFFINFVPDALTQVTYKRLSNLDDSESLRLTAKILVINFVVASIIALLGILSIEHLLTSILPSFRGMEKSIEIFLLTFIVLSMNIPLITFLESRRKGRSILSGNLLGIGSFFFALAVISPSSASHVAWIYLFSELVKLLGLALGIVDNLR